MTTKKKDDRKAKLIKRFYTEVTVEADDGGLYAVLLDGRGVKTPGKADLRLRTDYLADAVADEWRSQGEKIDPNTMPLTQIACTAIDRVAVNRAEIEGLISKYAETDLVCYRANAPSDLVQMQTEHWQPLLDWGADIGVQLISTTEILPQPQDATSLANVLKMVQSFDDHELSVVSVVTQASGSIMIALALAHGEIDADVAAKASQVDEIHQSQLWGLDHEAEVRLNSLNADILAAETYLRLHRA